MKDAVRRNYSCDTKAKQVEREEPTAIAINKRGDDGVR